MSALPESFWDAIAQFGLLVGFFPCRYLNFSALWSQFPLVHQLFSFWNCVAYLGICCFFSFLWPCRFMTLNILLSFEWGFDWEQRLIDMWIKFTMLNEINAYDWLLGILGAPHSDMIKVPLLLNSLSVAHLMNTFKVK